MIEKKVITTTTYKILEEKDVEEIMSKYVGREVKINEIDFILMDIVCFENDSFNYKDNVTMVSDVKLILMVKK